MRKLAISLTKGGVGKSTTAVNLAHVLALADSKVLLVDCDTQGQVSLMLGVRPEIGLAEVMTGEKKPQEAMTQARGNLQVLAGGRSRAGIKQTVSQAQRGAEHSIADALASVRGFDFVILDTAPGLDAFSVAVLFYAEEVLTPVSLESLTIRGLLEFHKSVNALRQYRPQHRLRYILPTFMDGRVRKSEESCGGGQSGGSCDDCRAKTVFSSCGTKVFSSRQSITRGHRDSRALAPYRPKLRQSSR